MADVVASSQLIRLVGPEKEGDVNLAVREVIRVTLGVDRQRVVKPA